MSTYDGAKEQVTIGTRVSDPFEMDYGLRQGSILSPILFILYVNDLIKEIETTGTGARGSGNCPQLILACIMFVDDIETYTHTEQGLRKQYEAAVRFARTHHAIINVRKSTMTSSKGSTALRAIGFRTRIKLEVLPTTKQLGTRIKAKDITTPSVAITSTDVAARSGATAAMIGTMHKRGMAIGKMEPSVMVEITQTIILPTLTFGLAVADLNTNDKARLRRTLAIATRAVVGLSAENDPNSTWATLEMGITDPVDDITMSDWATIAVMLEDQANPLATAVVMDDQDLRIATQAIMLKWGFTPRSLVQTNRHERHALLRRLARAYRIAQHPGTYFCPEGTPVWAGSTLSPKHIALATQYRAKIGQRLMVPITHCTLCRTLHVPQDHIQHYLSHCSHGAEMALCPARKKTLSPEDIKRWSSLDEHGISDLCAHPKGRENLLSLALDTLKHCHLLD
jgi:hypothetical protein